MKFGKRYEEAPKSTGGGGGAGGKWIKNFKEGDTRLRFLQEMKDWVVYYEHYNPTGGYFPCTGERTTCPGCTSDNERMRQASRKTAVNVLVGQYVDVYKLTTKLVDRLSIRADRNGGTVTDRDYIITRIGMDQNTEYDLESGNAVPIDLSAYQLLDIEAMLQNAFEETFPDFNPDGGDQSSPSGTGSATTTPSSTPSSPPSSVTAAIRDSIQNTKQSQNPPSEPAAVQNSAPQESGEKEVELTMDQLQTMTPAQLKELCQGNGTPVPDEVSEQGEIIDWMVAHFA